MNAAEMVQQLRNRRSYLRARVRVVRAGNPAKLPNGNLDYRPSVRRKEVREAKAEIAKINKALRGMRESSR